MFLLKYRSALRRRHIPIDPPFDRDGDAPVWLGAGLLGIFLLLLSGAAAAKILLKAVKYVNESVHPKFGFKGELGRRVKAILAMAFCQTLCVECQYQCKTNNDCNYPACTSLTSKFSSSKSCNCNPRDCNPYGCGSTYDCEPYKCNCGILWCDTCYSTCYSSTCYRTCYDTCSCSFTCSNSAICSSGSCITTDYSVTAGSTCCDASCSGSQSTCPYPIFCPEGTWSSNGYDVPGAGKKSARVRRA
jgi:hypothetical protein